MDLATRLLRTALVLNKQLAVVDYNAYFDIFHLFLLSSKHARDSDELSDRPAWISCNIHLFLSTSKHVRDYEHNGRAITLPDLPQSGWIKCILVYTLFKLIGKICECVPIHPFTNNVPRTHSVVYLSSCAPYSWSPLRTRSAVVF